MKSDIRDQSVRSPLSTLGRTLIGLVSIFSIPALILPTAGQAAIPDPSAAFAEPGAAFPQPTAYAQPGAPYADPNTAFTEPNIIIRLQANREALSILPGEPTQILHYRAQVEVGPQSVIDTIPGSYLGPTFHFRQGDRVRIHFENHIGEPTIVHWHGLIVPDSADGHPHQVIQDGEEYTYDFPILNRAGTYWYHPHPHQYTGPEVVRGLAGLLLVSDPEEQALALPRGAYDVPVVIQDHSFDENNQFQFYTDFMHAGFFGNKILVNGKMDTHISVATRVYRLRILNGSASRMYKLAWSDGTPMTVIATDGGLLETPVTRPYVFLAPAERVEVWKDLSTASVGAEVVLRSLAFMPGGMPVVADLPPGAPCDIMTLHVDRSEPETLTLPAHLSTIQRYRIDDAVNAAAPRTFAATFHEGMWLLNGAPFDMDTVAPNEIVHLNDLEMWELTNTYSKPTFRLPHPIHIHGVQFQVQRRTMEPSGALAYATVNEGLVDAGWKDTFFLPPGGTVRVLVRFAPYPGMFMYHCHNLPHEDMGMMRNYEVVAEPTGGTTDPGSSEDDARLDVPPVWSGSGPLSIRYSPGGHAPGGHAHESNGAPVTLRIFEATGRAVRVLTLPESAASTHGDLSTSWDLRNENGARAASGVYLIRLEAGPRALTRRLILVR